MRSIFFERYVQVEQFKHLSQWKTPPDAKGATYFVRTIFEKFQIFTFGDSRHPTFNTCEEKFPGKSARWDGV